MLLGQPLGQIRHLACALVVPIQLYLISSCSPVYRAQLIWCRAQVYIFRPCEIQDTPLPPSGTLRYR